MITRKEVNKLVRSLPKRIEKGNKRMQDVLHYQGKDNYVWLNMREQVTYKDMMWFPIELSEVYEEDREGNYKRKKLGYLDDMFYVAINNSDVAKRIKGLDSGLKNEVSRVNERLINLGIEIKTLEGKNLLEIKYDRKGSRGLLGEDVEKEYLRMLTRTGIGYNKDKTLTQEGYTYFRALIRDFEIEEWVSILKVVEELDRSITEKNRKEIIRKEREQKEEKELRDMFLERRRSRDNRSRGNMDGFKGRGRVDGNYRGVQSSFRRDSPLEELNFYGEYVGDFEDSTITISKIREDLYKVNQYDGELDMWLEFTNVEDINKQFGNILKK